MSYVDPAKSKLFRQEALDARRDRFQGSVLLTFPISSWLINASCGDDDGCSRAVKPSFFLGGRIA